MQSSAKQKKVKKWIGRIFSGLLFLIILVAVVILVIVVINNFKGRDNVIFGYRLIYVLTDSMEPELKQGTTILSKEVDAFDLKVGDYVTFIAPKESPLAGKRITHAVIREPYENYEDGKMYIWTQGVKEGATLDKPVPVENVLSRYVRTLVVVSFVVKLLMNPWGYALIIAFPLLGLLVVQFIKIAKIKSEEQAQKEQVELKNLEEELAKKAVEDYINSQTRKEEQNKGNK